MSRWYRAYEGTVTDAKLGEVALVAGCSRSVSIAAWHCILESCATCNDGGKFDTTPRRVAVILQEPVAVIEKVFAELASLGMIDEGAVAAWGKRQYESDSSTERSRKHRETKRNADATLQQRSATPPETETDTDTEYNLKQHSPTIPREAEPRSENREWDLLEARLREAAGWQNEPHPKLAVIGPIAELIRSGASLEMDVIPIIAALAPKCRSRSGWAYFVGPIQDAMATRVNARAPPSVAKSQAENVANLAALQEKYGWKPGAKAQAG